MSLSKKYPLFALLILLVDTWAISLGFVIAFWLRFSGVFFPFEHQPPSFENYFHAIVIAVPIFLLFFRFYRLYEPERQIRRVRELLNVAKAITAGAIFSMALTFFYREFTYSRIVLLFAWFFSILLACLGRYFMIQFEYFLRTGKARRNVLILGTNQSARDLIRWARENKHYGQDIVGILKTDADLGSEKTFEGVPILGTFLDFNRLINEQQFYEIILADTSIPRELTTELILKCEDKLIDFKLVADFYGLITHHLDVEYISNVPLLGLKMLPLDNIWNRVSKRLFDLTISFLALFFLTPFFALISFLIKLTSRGSVFYKQERIGRDGKQFNIYKFRTMAMDAEKATGPVWTKPDDERITFIGRFLRKTNLDELPQLWNVLIGNMSLVGPRPERPHFVEQFRGQIPRYMSRHKIKSGLTGWAQIHGLRGNTSLEERIKYDLYYMENWTLMMDIEILFATIFAYKNAY